MPETQSAIGGQFESPLSRWLRIEPLLGLAFGVSGGLLESAVLKTSLFSGGLLGLTFGLAFGLFFARRATSPGAGLIWGLGSSFLLWILTAGGFFQFVATTGHFKMRIKGAQGHFAELVGYVLCLGRTVGLGLGIIVACRKTTPEKKFAWV